MFFKARALCVVALALAAGVAHPADDSSASDDERTLKQAGVAIDDAGLLGFFRQASAADRDILALIKQLGDDAFDVREKASANLIALGPVAVPFLREALRSEDAEIVRRAETCLKHIGTGTPAAVVSAAARLLARRKPPGAADVLLSYLPRVAGERAESDIRAALAAVAVHDGRADAALLQALADKSAERRAAAAAALARGGARDRLPAVRKLLQDSDPTVRQETALALAALKEKEAIPVLIDLLAVLPRTQCTPVEDALCELALDEAPPLPADDSQAAAKKYRDAWAEWWRKHGPTADLAPLADAGRFKGYTMMVLLDAGRIKEVDADGKTRWQIDGLGFPLDAQRLPGDRVLVAEHKSGRVTERDRKGRILWEKRVEEPLVAQRLANGNTFIATRQEIVEIDRAGKQVFSTEPGGLILKAQKLDHGEMAVVLMVANGFGAEFVRLDAAGKPVTGFPVDVRTSGGRIDVLPNGRVLTPLKDRNKVVEYDATGQVVWQADFPQPVAAVRLANGHTMVTSYEDRRAVELDATGKPVWEYKAEGRLTRAWRR
jgi:hypothetical protein